jgi:hypothetical protein
MFADPGLRKPTSVIFSPWARSMANDVGAEAPAIISTPRRAAFWTIS